MLMHAKAHSSGHGACGCIIQFANVHRGSRSSECQLCLPWIYLVLVSLFCVLVSCHSFKDCALHRFLQFQSHFSISTLRMFTVAPWGPRATDSHLNAALSICRNLTNPMGASSAVSHLQLQGVVGNAQQHAFLSFPFHSFLSLSISQSHTEELIQHLSC